MLIDYTFLLTLLKLFHFSKASSLTYSSWWNLVSSRTRRYSSLFSKTSLHQFYMLRILIFSTNLVRNFGLPIFLFILVGFSIDDSCFVSLQFLEVLKKIKFYEIEGILISPNMHINIKLWHHLNSVLFCLDPKIFLRIFHFKIHSYMLVLVGIRSNK